MCFMVTVSWVISVLLVGAASAEDPAIEELKNNITTVKVEQEWLRQKIKSLKVEIKTQASQYGKQIRKLASLATSINADVKKLYDSLLAKTKEATKLQNEAQSVQVMLTSMKRINANLSLGERLVKENIDVLEAKEKSGVQQECYKWSRSFAVRGLNLLKIGKDIKIRKLKTELRLEKTELLRLKHIEEELDLKLKRDREGYEQEIKYRGKEIEESSGDKQSLKESVEEAEQTVKELKKSLASLQAQYMEELAKHEQHEKLIPELKKKWAKYKNAFNCYMDLIASI